MGKGNDVEQAMETVVREAAFILANVWLGEGGMTVTGAFLHVVCEQQEDSCCPTVGMCCLCLLTQAELNSLTIHRKG